MLSLSACGCLTVGEAVWKALRVWSSVVKVVSGKEKRHRDIIRQDLPGVSPTFRGEGSPAAAVPAAPSDR